MPRRPITRTRVSRFTSFSPYICCALLTHFTILESALSMVCACSPASKKTDAGGNQAASLSRAVQYLWTNPFKSLFTLLIIGAIVFGGYTLFVVPTFHKSVHGQSKGV